jgi:hypothetical protein
VATPYGDLVGSGQGWATRARASAIPSSESTSTRLQREAKCTSDASCAPARNDVPRSPDLLARTGGEPLGGRLLLLAAYAADATAGDRHRRAAIVTAAMATRPSEPSTAGSQVDPSVCCPPDAKRNAIPPAMPRTSVRRASRRRQVSHANMETRTHAKAAAPMNPDGAMLALYQRRHPPRQPHARPPQARQPHTRGR